MGSGAGGARSSLPGCCFHPRSCISISQVRPLFLARYLLASAPAIAITAAIGLVALWRRSRAVAIVAGAIVISLSLLARIQLEPIAETEDQRGAAQMVASQGREGDGLTYGPAFARVGTSWYLERRGGGIPTDLAVAPEGQAVEVGDLYAREVSPAILSNRLKRYPRVWLVGYPDSEWHPTPEPMLEAGVRVLRDEYRRVLSRDFGDIRVELYERLRATSE